MTCNPATIRRLGHRLIEMNCFSIDEKRQDTGFVCSKKQEELNKETAGSSGTLFFQSMAE